MKPVSAFSPKLTELEQTPFIPTSPKLTELKQKLDSLKIKAKAAHGEVIRLSRLRYPTQWHDRTVTRVTDVEAPTATFLGFKPQRDQPSVKTFGTSEDDDAARKQRVLDNVLAEKQLPREPTIKDDLETAQDNLAALETGIDFLTKEIEKEEGVLCGQYAKSFKNTHDKHMAALCASALDFHAKLIEACEGKRHLIESGVGLREGMYHNLPDSFLGSPHDPYSPFAYFINAAKAAGFIREVPQSLQMKVAR